MMNHFYLLINATVNRNKLSHYKRLTNIISDREYDRTEEQFPLYTYEYVK